MKHVRNIEAFPTLIQVFDLKDNPDIPYLLKTCKTHKTGDHGLIEKGDSTFNIKKGFLEDPKLSNLKKSFMEALYMYTTTIGAPANQIFITNSWFNRLEMGGSVTNHSHGDAVLAGAFYPEANDKMSSICFKNPTLIYQSSFPQTNNTKFQEEHISIKPESGMLVIFPGWLEHWTTINKSTDARITVSFNTQIISIVKMYGMFLSKTLNDHS